MSVTTQEYFEIIYFSLKNCDLKVSINVLLVQRVISVHCMCCLHGHLNICPCYRSVTATTYCNMAAVPVHPSARLPVALNFKCGAF